MNERIKELASKANATANDVVIFGGENYAGLRDDIFAELIVRECMEVVSRQCASPTAYNALVKHFGVKE